MIFDNEFRKTNDYKEMMAFILNINPHLPEYLCEMCIMSHFANPKAYKTRDKPKPVEVTEKPQSIYQLVEIISPLEVNVL
jgi:hypothetical protein